MGLGFANEEATKASSAEKIALVQEIHEQTSISKLILANFNYGELALMKNEITVDPWKFWDKQRGFTVNTLDKCAVFVGLSDHKNRLSRLCAKYREVLSNATFESGNTYAFDYQLDRGLDMRQDQREAVESILVENKMIHIYKDKIYDMSLVSAEAQIAQAVMAMVANTKSALSPYRESPSYGILEPEQKAAVDAIRDKNFVIMTGYPGTGKTRTISAIAEMFDDVTLIAPTGKAARRITEMCGIEARTVHSVVWSLELYNALIQNTLIVIDEASMLDVEIAGKFFSRIDTMSCKLLIVGDTCQLPSVGPGQVLHDLTENELCKAGVYPHIHLTKIKRQEPGSIVLSAHSIAKGEDLIKGEDKRLQVYYYRDENLSEVTAKIAASDKWQGAQFLTVLRERCADVLNPVIQNVVNKGEHKWRVGDRVIHLKNDRERNVMNGDMGEVISVVKQGFLARYANAEVFYTPATEWMVSLAYAFTVHKSQGSEFDKVVLVLNRSRITNRNILYTGITRAVNNVLIVAEDEDVVWDAIDTVEKPRLTTLRTWLRKYAKEITDGPSA